MLPIYRPIIVVGLTIFLSLSLIWCCSHVFKRLFNGVGFMLIYGNQQNVGTMNCLSHFLP